MISLRLALACGMGLLFTACGLFPSESDEGGTPRLGRLTVMLQVGSDGRNYQTALGKSAVTLSRAIITMTSAGGQVVRDTITPLGSRLSREPAYLRETPDFAQELLLRYELKPSVRWDIDVKVLDTQDSVRYSGSITVEDMDAFEYLDGCIPVGPHFAVIEGRFRLPAAIESDGVPGSARGLRTLYLTRLELLVDSSLLLDRRPYNGQAVPGDERFIVADPAKLGGADGMRFFRPVVGSQDPPLVVSHDYGNVLNSEFTVAAFGYVEGDIVGVTPERLLFQGTRKMDLTAAKVAVEEPVVMAWKAIDAVPVDITTGFDVRLGRAGKVVINVIVPSGVDI